MFTLIKAENGQENIALRIIFSKLDAADALDFTWSVAWKKP